MRTNSFYRLLISGYVFSIFSEGIILPIYAVFVQGIGGDILDASGAMATFLILQGVFTVFIHRIRIVNKYRLFFLVLGWGVWVVGIAMYLYVSSVFTLLLTQVLTAFGNAVADPIFDREFSHHTDRRAEGSEWGMFEGGAAIVSGLAAIVGGLLASTFGFHALIIFMVVAATFSLGFITTYALHQRRLALKRCEAIIGSSSDR